jgi:type III restriction enzyme
MMERCTIDRLIINSPYEEPKRYWRYNRESRTFTLVEASVGQPAT